MSKLKQNKVNINDSETYNLLIGNELKVDNNLIYVRILVKL